MPPRPISTQDYGPAAKQEGLLLFFLVTQGDYEYDKNYLIIKWITKYDKIIWIQQQRFLVK